MAILPPGVTAEQFEVAIRAFEAAVGREWVYTSDDDLLHCLDSIRSILDAGAHKAHMQSGGVGF